MTIMRIVDIINIGIGVVMLTCRYDDNCIYTIEGTEMRMIGD